ncbi:MAG: hypothetical protein GY888_19090 [Planctomycetaceae bacterium]|nr:hypothetical protein [Planctomycetaceae bacterium]
MKLATWIFILYLAIGGILAASFFVAEVPSSQGQVHPTHPDMSIGGDSRRNDNVFWLGTSLGVLEMILFASMLCLAIHLNRLQRILMAVGAGLMVVIFLAMTLSYRSLLATGSLADPPIFMGLPVPTAFMIYGLGLAPLFFVIFYVMQFDSCVLQPERYEKFNQVLAERQAAGEEDQ